MKLRALLLATALLSVVPYAVAQSVSGSITGSVIDPSGAALPGATITVANQSTGVETPTKSNGAGYFNASNLIAGIYRVDVSAPGFKSISRSDVQVDIGSVVRLDFRLEVGNVQDKITVSGEAPLLQVDKVELGGTVTEKVLLALP